ncbi:hypothetical protein Anas_12913 [Armadillidium nasatum]|uniref:Vesicular, overexpressed in cancer, prosurvival protein 1 n=1 Tax=Armadillidium nasatum TaxID=96803 RepID=A0A5N5T2S5_9CRUS|nr:hypothetical protein Anas_12913 [Armadillidium nasatum]
MSNYCEWDLCRSDQYCCGDNTCCDYVYSLWYFWVGVIFLILMLSACGGLFRLYYRSWKMQRNWPAEILDEDPLYQVTTGDNMKSPRLY